MDDNQATTGALSSPPSARELVACWEEHVQRHALSATSVVIGRSETCDVRIPHASMSRTHARLELGERGMELEDLGSSNGCLVDGTPVKGRARLLVGSIVELGTVRLVVRLIALAPRSPMDEVRRLVAKIAPSSASLILLGETGVGKEVLTEEIHARSGRSGPLVRLNCAGLTASLLESELFGYERGAFTGAVQAKPGLIESAHGGTLFLDELGEMPEATQPKLLRVLESREVRRIGSVRTKSVDVRFVSATHRDPRTLAVMGKFRDDLLFRLNGLTISIPPLRERRQEILELAEAFLRSACERAGRAVPTLSEGARVLLESYRWPGNVRELRNVIERVALLAEGHAVLGQQLIFDPAHIEPLSGAELAARAAAVSERNVLTHAEPSGGDARETSTERQRIVDELAAAGGNQAVAAKALGITPRVLGYRMDKLGLPRPRRR
jgi:transcriptional regulator with GAF, ATPase, and Fis domain